MHAILFFAGGLFFLFIAHYGRLTFERFRASSRRVPGVVVATQESVSRSASGTTVFELPIVEYSAGPDSRYRFQGEIDVDRHGLAVGDAVTVLVSSDNDRVAKLERASKEKVLVLRVLNALGCSGCALGLCLFDPGDYRLAALKEPVVLGSVALLGYIAATRIPPLVRQVRSSEPVYAENARKVGDGGTR
jgi:hypothetical protein